MRIQQIIEKKLQTLKPDYLEVINESSMHNVPEGSESHFKVTIVSEAFIGQMLLARHRAVNALLAEELSHSIHALALHTQTPEEWFEKSGSNEHASPPCLGGSASNT